MTPEQARALARARARVRLEQEARTRGVDAGGRSQTATPEPNEAQRAEVARRASARQATRFASPIPGLGFITQPIINTIQDPARRQAAGDSASGFVRDLRELPNLNWGQLATDTRDAIGQGVQNLPGTLGNIVTHIPQIVRGATYGPFEDEENAQQRVDLARVLGDQQGEQTAAREANGQAANAIVNAGAPVAFAGATPLRAVGLASALAAPHALSGEGSLQERIPNAVPQILGAGAIGGGLQALARSAPRPAPRPTETNVRAAEFEQAGVRPPLAAVEGKSAAPLTMAIAENPVGGNVRRNLQNSADDVAARARETAAGYGQHGQPENVGEAVQAGVERFARDGDVPQPRAGDPRSIPVRDWSFRAKASALYDQVFNWITRDEAAHLEGRTGARATAENARQALRDIQGEVSAPNVADIVSDPTIARVARALEQDADSLRFNDLRRLRTWVREARERPALTQTVDQAAMSRLESALTQDIYESAAALGGRQAAQDLLAVDRWYRRLSGRVQNALQPFADRTGRGAYDRIISLAREGGRQNSRQLEQLRASLRPDEWREVSATVIDEMGRPAAGNARALEAGEFSLENFVTNYAKLSQEGRRVLFDSDARLMQQLDNLARVAGYLKQVKGFTNWSRSGSSLQNMSTLTAGLGATGAAALGNAAPLATLVALGLATRITGEMLTNPAFVRWLASQTRAGTATSVRAHAQALGRLAARDPALAPLAAELSQRAPASNDNQRSRSQQRAGGSR